ncbi:MAG: Lrp/AsnC family transcriptional regulator [Thermoleophilia bacterium]
MPAHIDDRILGCLLRNGRASFAEIALEVGLSPHATAERVRRLERRGVIRGYTAEVDPQVLGRGLGAYIDVRLLPTTDAVHFERLALSLPATRKIVFVTGRFDFVVELACRDTDDLDETVRRLRTSGGVAATETRIVMRALSPAVSR